MELTQLTERAMQIHAAFAARARREDVRPWTREEVMQGFVGDVGDLMKLVMAKAGARRADEADRKLAHELGDCLWSVLVLARLYQVDLEKEFLRTMDELEDKGQGPAGGR
ncbi:MAG: MazG nucleotide pyrophosphohydrolase domain-containing protein [Verrucomicrobiota bacterium]